MISKQLVDLFILKRRIRLDEILIDLGLFRRDDQGRIIPNLSRKKLLKETDSVIYTLDFLLMKKYIKEYNSSNLSGLSFHGYAPQNNVEVSHIIYIEEYLSERLGETYAINPPLFQYKERNYRTQLQKQYDDNFKTAISAALLSSGLTAFLTALFTRWVSN